MMVLSIPALALRRVRTLRAMEDLRRGQRGVGAMEFALLAPVLVVSIIGLAAMSQGIRTKMLLTSAASSMAAMVAVQNSVTGGSAGTLQDFCTGAQLIMQPYAAKGLSMAITSYTQQSNSTPGKDWEYDGACQGSAGSLASSGSALASPLLVATGDSVIIVKASYNYTSTFSMFPNLVLTQIAYSRPRYSKVTCASGC